MPPATRIPAFEQINRPDVILDRFDHIGDLFLDPDIDAERNAAHLVCYSLRAVPVQIDANDFFGPFRRKLDGERLADTACGTGDDDNFIFQFHGSLSCPHVRSATDGQRLTGHVAAGI